MSNLRLTNKLNEAESSTYILESDIDKAVAQSQKEQLDLIKSHFVIKVSNLYSSISLNRADIQFSV